MSGYHISVMPKESIDFLKVQKNNWYVDCNLGGGGHTELILKKGGNVVGIDLDPDAINEVSENLKKFISQKKLILAQTNFANIKKVLIQNKIEKVAGILFDLGVSTHQLEEGSRGFSFNKDAMLDMRMDPTTGVPARDLINGLHEGELAELFLKLGEENFAKPIAKKIVQYRKSKLIFTTDELSKIILSVRRRSPDDRTHPATRVFQALRIAVNDELNSLREALPEAFESLKTHGRIVVISFHSLEDRIVKNYFKELEQKKLAEILTDKPVETSEEESNQNPRSRSGKLRAVEKI